ncbi:ornithine cyclodeaminase [Terriglobus saanensis]|uniref:Ornithine cyclodeaminase n=1 Tax=Terriglobus saanensis (strain ATCC BAA-1853 / DSM 23119 / SP1PR4) TaxID=401053 RepID=E8V3F3_TERSS|nr:ornithine cyclodeaminase [Terriglobus saanensis]ADV83566.1 Ornithine cyclodeaminase [Terriglobus saanensis SP1PR4]
MAKVYSRALIEALLDPQDVIVAMEEAFVAYSRGEAVVPPVGEMLFKDPPGDCHIKYGYLKHGTTFTIKVATGFWNNPGLGLPSSNGVVLVFSRLTGELLVILQDEGYLTNVRTAAAGAVAAKYLAPSPIECIGMVGAGIQAKLQLEYLRSITSCRKVKLWARSNDRARAFHVDGFEIEVCPTVKDVARNSQLIITTTASTEALLFAGDVSPGTHITAVGADGGEKQELDPQLFALAKLRIVDSRSQCSAYGDSSFALARNLIAIHDLTEIGEMIENETLRRQNRQDITIADLTGVAVQDIAIASRVLAAFENNQQ